LAIRALWDTNNKKVVKLWNIRVWFWNYILLSDHNILKANIWIYEGLSILVRKYCWTWDILSLGSITIIEVFFILKFMTLSLLYAQKVLQRVKE